MSTHANPLFIGIYVIFRAIIRYRSLLELIRCALIIYKDRGIDLRRVGVGYAGVGW